MTKEEMIELAKQAGFEEHQAKFDTRLEPFAKLVAEKAIKEALAQPEQEPVAWGVFEGNLHDMFFSPSEAQEMADLKGTHAEVRPLYTTPPQRKPQYDKTKMNCFVQDLYDKKIQEGKHGQYEAMFHVVHRAIEAAHGIKE